MSISQNLVGMKFGMLTVVREVSVSNNGQKELLCRCNCGNMVNVWQSHLTCQDRPRMSCGCLQELRSTRVYTSWRCMKQRCLNKNSTNYSYYGGRGISICDEWMMFPPFYEWSISHGYQEDLTLDRIDNDGNYTPDNCRWVDWHTQASNRRPRQRKEWCDMKKSVSQDQTDKLPIWRQYTLSVEEASEYFRIGINKMRNIVKENPDAPYIVWNGNRAQIKREKFEQYIDTCNGI